MKINQMKTHNLGELPVWILAGCFVVQTFFLSASIKPRDVFQAVQSLRVDLVSSIQQARTELSQIQSELDKRGKWMGGIDEELGRQMQDRVFRHEVDTMLKQLAADNPDLKVPTLPELEQKADPPTLQR